MNRRYKIISMIMAAGLILSGLINIEVEAKQVEVKNQTNPDVKIVFLNNDIDENVREIVFRIKNREDSKIKIKKIEFQVRENGEWTSFEKKEGAKTQCRISIGAKEEAYESILLKQNYMIPETGLPTGKYGVCIKYKYQGTYYYARKTFNIVRRDSVDNTADTAETAATGFATAVKTTLYGAKVSGDSDKILLLNWDFSIDETGKCRAMIFSDTCFQNTDKVKITLKVQKKETGRWKKYKKYKVTKKSSVAFINKNLKIKTVGTYRMSVKMEFYKNGTRQGGCTVKTRSQHFSKGR